MIIRPRNWAKFQHYKDRSPPWIRLHRSLLDDYEWHCLPVASRALAPCLWLLAAESDTEKQGEIVAEPQRMAFRLRMSEKDFCEALKPLIERGFFELVQDASNALAPCYQDATPETETETETETENNLSGAIAPNRYQPEDDNETFSSHSFPLRDGTRFRITSQQVAQLRQAYPLVDVDAELTRLSVWNDANPGKRKTIRGALRHVTSWLSRQQSEAASNGADRQARRPSRRGSAVERVEAANGWHDDDPLAAEWHRH